MHIALSFPHRIKSHLGSGGFANVFKGENVMTSQDVAIKIETESSNPSSILTESSVYERVTGAPGFPTFHNCGIAHGRRYLVLDLLGNSIGHLFRNHRHHFSLKTTLMLIDQMLARVEYLHHNGYLHCDLKPSNFLMGINSRSNTLYLIDFGLASPIGHAEAGRRRHFSGTPCYASINVQSGREPAPRDDLESLGYVFIHLATGSLPWLQLDIQKSLSFAAVMDMKKSCPISQLCHGLPPAFAIYMEDVRALGFADQPDYGGYRQLFRELFCERGFVYDYRYDWIDARRPRSFRFGPWRVRGSALATRGAVKAGQARDSKGRSSSEREKGNREKVGS
jgi:serine/threonine protein kinase